MTTTNSRAGGAPKSALDMLGADFDFPNRIDGLPSKLSDFTDLKIGQFRTSDAVELRYWEAGSGFPLIFVPGWSSNGAEYVNVMYLLSKVYRVIVLDHRNQGLSDKVEYGTRIARFATDLKELNEYLGITSAHYCGWSMGASVLWSYIDLFGTEGIRKAVFVDQAVAIVERANWSKLERLNCGSFASSSDALIDALGQPVPENIDPDTTDIVQRSQLRDSLFYDNSERFANFFIRNDPSAMARILYDHGVNDWSDVIRHKVRIPVAIFTGEYSGYLPSQRWIQSSIPDSTLFVYSKSEQGDHFLMFKNPLKFTQDLRSFLDK